MLQPGDVAVVQRDSALPDLALLLDPECLSAALERTLGRRGLAQPTVTYLRYKPGQSCLAACRLDVDGETLEFSAKAHRLGSDNKPRKAMQRPSVPSPFGLGRFLLHDSAVVISVFPNDSKLRSLARLGSAETLSRLVHRLDRDVSTATSLGRRDSSPAVQIGDSSPDLRMHTLRYNPERRFVGRLTADGRAIATVRCYTAHDYEPAKAKAGAIKSRDTLRVARVRSRRDRLRLLAFNWLTGESLDEAIRQDTVSAAGLRLVGTALAELHGQDAPGLPRAIGAFEARSLRRLARDLGEVCPDIAADSKNLARRLAAGVEGDGAALRPIHGDFYPKQVLLQDKAVAVLDLDEAALGETAVDLARFQADLEASVIGGRLSPSRAHEVMGSFLEGYRHGGRELPAHLNLHVAVQLFRLAPHPFRRREPSWPEKSAALLERARFFLQEEAKVSALRMMVPNRTGQLTPETRASCGSVTNAPHVSSNTTPIPQAVDPFGVTIDPTMPFLTSALDLDAMGPHFARELHCFSPGERVDVYGACVTRYKPGRRCLISYDIAVQAVDDRLQNVAVVGKVRARGADVSTDRLLWRLWTGSFGPDTHDDILVPEPLGVVPALHMSVQRKVAGEPVGLLLEGAQGLRLSRRVAEAIDKLHRENVPSSRRHSIQDEIRILHDRLGSVAEAHARWRQRIDALLTGCARLAARVKDGQVCGIHRDFYADQLLADGDRVYLLDLDLYCEGHPALDVGNFLAHVDEYSLRRFGNLAHLADRKEALLDRYLELSPRTTRNAIEVYAALSLARQVAISRQFPERRVLTEPLLELCEQRILGTLGMKH